ncbi:hypothetical protein HMPREF3034_01567 [Prevotella sp. DNF00663]|nr:hypothetical protein HMPREF3034_01567 [Prevotella sp. DNF00663]
MSVPVCFNQHCIALTKTNVEKRKIRIGRRVRKITSFPSVSLFFPAVPCRFVEWKEAHTFARRNMRWKANRKRKI